MKYLKTNDEVINRINTARQEDYWDLYLIEFENQIYDYAEAYEWDKAYEACQELYMICSKFPKKWWDLDVRYKRMAQSLKTEIKDMHDLEINILEENE